MKINLWECSNCDFSIYCNDSGGDIFRNGMTKRYLCFSCENLFEVYHKSPFLRDLYGEDDDDDDYDGLSKEPYLKPQCPECRTRGNIRWNPKDSGCPKCGNKLIKHEDIWIHTY